MLRTEEAFRRAAEDGSCIKQLKRRWVRLIGHILRHSKLTKRVIIGTTEEEIYKGRPRSQFMTQTMQCGACMEVERKTNDGVGWELLTARLQAANRRDRCEKHTRLCCSVQTNSQYIFFLILYKINCTHKKIKRRNTCLIFADRGREKMRGNRTEQIEQDSKTTITAARAIINQIFLPLCVWGLPPARGICI